MRVCTFSFYSDKWKQSSFSHLNFRIIFKTQSHATEKVKLQKRPSERKREKKYIHVQNYTLHIKIFSKANMQSSSEYPNHLSAFCRVHIRAFSVSNTLTSSPINPLRHRHFIKIATNKRKFRSATRT